MEGIFCTVLDLKNELLNIKKVGSSQNLVGGMKDAHMTIPDEQV